MSSQAQVTAPTIFVQYFNDQILDIYSVHRRFVKDTIVDSLTSTTILASLFTDRPLLIPAVDIIQSEPGACQDE